MQLVDDRVIECAHAHVFAFAQRFGDDGSQRSMLSLPYSGSGLAAPSPIADRARAGIEQLKKRLLASSSSCGTP